MSTVFAKVCNILMFVHAFFARRACAQYLDYTRNNVWNAIILEAVPGILRVERSYAWL